MTNGRAWNAVSAFANCGRAVAHVRGSYVPNSGHRPRSFDHLVGAGEKHRGHVEAEQLSAGTAEQIVERSIRAG
jgi:hypothetical protein